jgi:hypothetical protein
MRERLIKMTITTIAKSAREELKRYGFGISKVFVKGVSFDSEDELKIVIKDKTISKELIESLVTRFAGNVYLAVDYDYRLG